MVQIVLYIEHATASTDPALVALGVKTFTRNSHLRCGGLKGLLPIA